MVSVALRMLGRSGGRADATQDAFIKVYRRLGDSTPGYRFYSWMYRILINEC